MMLLLPIFQRLVTRARGVFTTLEVTHLVYQGQEITPVSTGAENTFTAEQTFTAGIVTDALTVDGTPITGEGGLAADEENTFTEAQTFQMASLVPVMDEASIVTNGEFTSDLSGWTVGANWAWNSGGAKHTAGSDEQTTQVVTGTQDAFYVLSAQISGMTAGWVDIYTSTNNWGGDVYTEENGTFYSTFIAYNADTSTLKLTCSEDFDGKIEWVRIQLASEGMRTPIRITDPDGDPTLEVRTNQASRGNTFVGLNVGVTHDGGSRNTALGSGAFQHNLFNSDNVAVGYQALQNVENANNTAVGSGAMQEGTNRQNNVAVGKDAMKNGDIGNGSVAVGKDAALSNEGNNNVAVGLSALAADSQAASNVAVGAGALQNVTNHGNVALGYHALNALTDGARNIAIGGDAGANADTSDSIFIGTGAGTNETLGNKLHIGNNDTLSLLEGTMATSAGSQVLIVHASTVVLADLPTSAAGLPVGALWRDAAASNVIKAVPPA